MADLSPLRLAHCIAALICLISLGLQPGLAEEPQPVGGAVMVALGAYNEFMGAPGVQVAPAGDFVVSWSSQFFSYPYFAASATRRSNTDHSAPLDLSEAFVPSRLVVTPRTEGGFVVVWRDDAGTWIRRLNADGTRLGDMAAFGSMDAEPIAVMPRAGGSFQVLWRESGAVNGRLYDADGLAMGDDFALQASGAIEPMPNDGFVAVRTSGGDIVAQRMSSDGMEVGAEIAVNTTTEGTQGLSSVDSNRHGDFAVVWSDGSTSPSSIRGQRLTSSGELIGSEFLISPAPGEYPGNPDVDLSDDGHFMVVWTDPPSAVRGRFFDPSGTQVGNDMLIASSTSTEVELGFPDVDRAPRDGDFVVSWRSYFYQYTGTTISSRRYTFGSIFKDGFESGNTNSWN